MGMLLVLLLSFPLLMQTIVHALHRLVEGQVWAVIQDQ